jgi:hypothetical protein
MANRPQKRHLPNDMKMENNLEKRTFVVVPLDIEYLIHQFSHDKWIMKPTYQREPGLWPLIKQQQLIHSVLENLPINQIYLLEEVLNDGTTEVGLFDGLQRISTLRAFAENKLLVPTQFIPSQILKADKKELQKASFEDLNAIGQHHFRNYKIPVITLTNIKNKLEYFERINYTCSQTHGERLHACNTVRSRQIYEFAQQILDRIMKSKGRNEKRCHTFQRLCTLVFIESQGLEALKSKAAVTSFISEDDDSPAAFLDQLRLRMNKIPGKIHENHLIALLMVLPEAEKLTLVYPMIVKDPILLLQFNRLAGKGKSISSITAYMSYFKALASLHDNWKSLCTKYLRSAKQGKSDEKQWDILKVVYDSYEQHTQVIDEPGECQICEKRGELEIGYDGGLWNRDFENQFHVCHSCNRKMTFFQID